MSTQPSSAGHDPSPPSRRSSAPFVIAGVFIAAAIFLPLWVSSYAKEGPKLLGFPFFYWYQLLWVFGAAICVSIAYRLVTREEAARREERRRQHVEGGEGLR